MPCAIINCTVTDDKHVWYCHGSCGKKFHASCVGAQRNHEQSILSYMLPLCYECQKRFVLEINFDKFYIQQQENIKLSKLVLESNHKLAAKFNNLNINDGFESMEMLLNELKTVAIDGNKLNSINEPVASKNSTEYDNTAIKNHLTSLFDMSMQATKNNIMEYVNALTIDLTTELKNICSEFEKVSSLIIDMANHCSEHNASQSNLTSTVDIIDELKVLSSAVNLLGNKTVPLQTTESPPSLEVELTIQTSDNSGWRQLGSRRMWKSDWSEYDARKLLRLNQQKAADKAKLKKKRRKQKYSRGIENLSYRGNPCREFINNNRCINPLPLDRDLLAAAKDRFSRPVPYRPTIRFRRGEVLNPYPTETGEFLNPYPVHDEAARQTPGRRTFSGNRRNTSYRSDAATPVRANVTCPCQCFHQN